MLNEYNDADVMKDLRHTDVTRGCYGNDNHHHRHHYVGSSRQRHTKVANAPESRFLPTPPAFPSEYCHAVWYKLEWLGYPTVKIF